MLVTVVILNKPKELTGLDQKVGGWFGAMEYPPTRATLPPADRVGLRYPLSNTRNVVAPCHRPLGRLTVRQAVGGLDWRAETSEGFTVMVEIPVETGPAPKGGLTFGRSLVT